VREFAAEKERRSEEFFGRLAARFLVPVAGRNLLLANGLATRLAAAYLVPRGSAESKLNVAEVEN
jgi:hypothetical protein